MHLETTWDVQIDEHGVIDGRELARQMIASAYLALVPYVDACPACADDLFSAIANKAIHDVRQEGMTGAGLYVGPTPAHLSQAEAEEAHLRASVETTRAMLEGTGHHHH
ncbi:hypothetical protein [Methylobacterium sp. E-046]|uniref:hypothetical protein n=1 Tax=Methylobacterium sp. E-046 TaxID=2836576 RepID=UPI001FB9A3F5|nr:hypothetical protein [Methylobacterium sp. E-046]MCJ2097478.1 hypothetical protein [Methylobacterium sp. E-046]